MQGYGQDGSSTTYAYGVSGDNATVTIAENVKNTDGTFDSQEKLNEYDILGQLKATTDGYGTVDDPHTTYEYDANGHMTKALVSDGSTTEAVEIHYDAAGNRTEVVDSDSGTSTMTYTGLNELMTRTDAKGQQSTYTWDQLGRLEKVVNVDGTSQWTWDTATNGLGMLKSRSGPGFLETYYYDSNSRLQNVLDSYTPIGGGSPVGYSTTYTYDAQGRHSTTTFPGGFILTWAYNARGYLSQLKNGATAVQTINDRDAFGNSVDESYVNGVNTLRTYDPATGRLTDINTAKGGIVVQNDDYAWRSNGTLGSRIANPATGLNSTRKEYYQYDVLNRLILAQTYINSSNTRNLNYAYNEFGNITSKTSTLSGDIDVSGYTYGTGNEPNVDDAGTHAVTGATIGSTGYVLHYDDNGGVTYYDISGTSDDKYIAYNAGGQPTKIVVGSSLTDTTPVAKDELAYGPNGQRYARKTTWQDGANTYTENVAYIGPVQVISDNSSGSAQTITKIQISPNVMHVKIVGTTTEEFFEYAHRDHLGSIEVVTDDNGNVLDNVAFEPFGSRKKKDWTANISTTELNALLDVHAGHTRKARGFTGHEHLDRTGFIHMNGRVYDPTIARFLSPDPIVQNPSFSQSWNRYSYVNNAPSSFTDPSGFACEYSCGGALASFMDGYKSAVDFFMNLSWMAENLKSDLENGAFSTEPQPTSYQNEIDFANLDNTLACGGIATTPCLGVGSLGNDPRVAQDRQLEASLDSMAGVYAWRMSKNDLQNQTIDVMSNALLLANVAELPVLGYRGGIPLARRLLLSRSGASAAREATEVVPLVLRNKAAGDAFRDVLAADLQKAGREVATEVYKATPFGARFIDIEVSMDGTVLGGIETKVGTSRYLPLQQLKDWWLINIEGYPVNLARNP